MASEDTCLDSSSVGHCLIGIYASVGLLAVEEVLEHTLNLGDAGRAPNENYFVNLTPLHVGICKHTLDWL